MKSNLFFSLLLSSSVLFVSCKNEKETEVVTSNETAAPVIIPPRTAPIPNEASPQMVSQNGTVPQNQVPAQTTTQTVVPAPVATKAGMNPPHGQPGHRCDIAVGAPLNSPVKAQPKTGSAPATITQQTMGTPVQSTTTTQTSGTPELLKSDAPVVTAPGMNPPHGQPGHQCGIPVGSPLPKATETK